MKIIKIFVLTLFMVSCSESRELKYYGFDDGFAGVYEVKLFENGEFSIELGAGAKEGLYTKIHDTVNLKYHDSKNSWPNQIVVKDSVFLLIEKGNEFNIKTVSRIRLLNKKFK